MSQSEKPSRKSSLKNIKYKILNFSQSVGLSPQRMLLSVILLVALGGLIFFLGFSGSGDGDNSALTREEILKEQDKLDQRLEQLLSRKISRPGNYLVSIDQIQETETEISDLEASHALTPTQEETVARIRLRNKSSTLMEMMYSNLSHDAERADLFQFCETYKDAGESTIRDESRYWLCAVPTIEFALAPSEETLQSFSSAIEREDSYLTSRRHATALAEILRTIKPGEKSKLVATGMRRISQRMQGSDDETVRSIGEQLVLLEIFGKHDLATLGTRIAWKNPSAPADEEGAITALSNNIQVVPASVWGVIINAYESHLSHGDVGKVGASWQRMWALSEQLESEDSKTQVQTKLRRQKRRAMMIGTTLDISGTGLKDGKPLDFGNYEYVAIIFFDEGNSSLELMNKMIAVNQIDQPNFYSVMAFEEAFTQEDIGKMKTRPGAAIVTDETYQKYQKELLVDSAPYIVLVDRSGKILNSQLEFDQIENRVARMKSNRSTGAAATP